MQHSPNDNKAIVTIIFIICNKVNPGEEDDGQKAYPAVRCQGRGTFKVAGLRRPWDSAAAQRLRHHHAEPASIPSQPRAVPSSSPAPASRHRGKVGGNDFPLPYFRQPASPGEAAMRRHPGGQHQRHSRPHQPDLPGNPESRPNGRRRHDRRDSPDPGRALHRSPFAPCRHPGGNFPPLPEHLRRRSAAHPGRCDDQGRGNDGPSGDAA